MKTSRHFEQTKEALTGHEAAILLLSRGKPIDQGNLANQRLSLVRTLSCGAKRETDRSSKAVTEFLTDKSKERNPHGRYMVSEVLVSILRSDLVPLERRKQFEKIASNFVGSALSRIQRDTEQLARLTGVLLRR
jgi:hypothetical protein